MGNGQKNLARADLGNAHWKKSGTGRSGHCHFGKKVARAFCVVARALNGQLPIIQYSAIFCIANFWVCKVKIIFDLGFVLA